MNIIADKIEIEFTEEKITLSAGSIFLSAMAKKLVRHARKWKLLFAKSALRLHWISYAADCIASG